MDLLKGKAAILEEEEEGRETNRRTTFLCRGQACGRLWTNKVHPHLYKAQFLYVCPHSSYAVTLTVRSYGMDYRPQ